MTDQAATLYARLGGYDAIAAVGFAVLVDWSGVAVTSVVAAAGVAWRRRLGAARTGTPRDAPATGPAPRS